jgi:hypothetical protein
MRFVKLGLISIVILSIFIMLLSLLFPSEVRVSRAINVNAKKEKVALLISDMRYWESWNELLKSDDLQQKQFTPEKFLSDKMEIDRMDSDSDHVRTLWKRKGADTVSGYFNLYSADTTVTVVHWYFDFKIKWYPWEKFGSIIFDKQIGPPMEKSLEVLKKMGEE